MESHGVWMILIGACMIALGAYILISNLGEIRTGRRSSSWLSAPGRVTRSRAVRGKYWSFDIGYDYEVAGMSYDSDMLQAGHATSRSEAEALEQDYPVGAEVTVYYDPDRPSRAVLIPGMGSSKPYVGILAATVALGFGVWMLATVVGRLVNLSPPSPQAELPFAHLNDPMGVAVDGADAVYVCDGRAAQLPGLPSPTALVPGFPPPPGFPVPPGVPPARGRLLVLDSRGSGEFLRSTFVAPTGVAVDTSGRMYVIDGSRLWVFTMSQLPDSPGRTEIKGAQPLTNLQSPGGVAANSAGTAYIAERSTGRILQLPAGSNTATEFFKAPADGTATDVAVDRADHVYVTDSRSGRVLRFASDGTASTELPFTGLSQPQGVAVDTAGNVYVVDSGNSRVVKLAAATNTQTELPFAGLKEPTDVAVDSVGNVFVTDRGNRRVLQMPAEQTN